MRLPRPWSMEDKSEGARKSPGSSTIVLLSDNFSTAVRKRGQLSSSYTSFTNRTRSRHSAESSTDFFCPFFRSFACGDLVGDSGPDFCDEAPQPMVVVSAKRLSR